MQNLQSKPESSTYEVSSKWGSLRYISPPTSNLHETFPSVIDAQIFDVFDNWWKLKNDAFSDILQKCLEYYEAMSKENESFIPIPPELNLSFDNLVQRKYPGLHKMLGKVDSAL